MRDDKQIFDEYFESIFSKSNRLRKEDYIRQMEANKINLLPILPKNKDAKILDIGSGCGHLLYSLKEFGYTDFYGIDLSPQQVKYCRENVSEKVEVIDPFEFLKDKPGSFDCIIMITVLEHIQKEKIIDLLKLIHSALKPGGTFISVVPNMSNPFAVHLRYRDFSHESGFNETSLEQVLWLAGFREIKLYPSKIFVHSFKTWVRSLLIKMYYKNVKFLYYIQDFPVPNILSARLIGIGKKSYD